MNYLDNMRININCPELDFKGQWMDVNMRVPTNEDMREDIEIREPKQGGEVLFCFRATSITLDNRCRTIVMGFCTKGDSDFMKSAWYRACLMVFYPPRTEDSFKPLPQSDSSTAKI